MDTHHKKDVFSVKKAHRAQQNLAKHVVLEDRLPEHINIVGGVDVAYHANTAIGAACALEFGSHKLVESQTAYWKTCIPYIPTLLSFREIPPMILSIRKLRVKPDVVLVDGQGFSHPRHCGLASHLGLVLNMPTIGVAKSRLFGSVENHTASESVAYLRDQEKIVGAVIKTGHKSRPIYVSVGHMVSLDTGIRIVKDCTADNRLPEPLLKAHEIAEGQKRKLHISSTSNR